MQKLIALAVFCGLLAGCQEDEGDTTVRDDYTNHFSALPQQAIFPQDNQYSEAKAKLGEFLFWDPILSGNENVACASCHHPNFGWADGRKFSIGVDGVGLGPDRIGFAETPIHAPTVANTAFTGFQLNTDPDNFIAGPYFWDLRADSLETQSLGPIANAIEMRGEAVSEADIFPTIEARLANIQEYQALFSEAFPDEEQITMSLVAKALATYQRTLFAGNSRFDQFIAGDTSVFNAEEVAGLNKFIDAGCARCHNGPMLSDNLIHETQPVLQHSPAVRTPSLRNISATAPYMHTGERETLGSAISLYEGRDDLDVSLGDDDFGKLDAFLRTLNTPSLSRRIPERVPSGLPIGGDIN